MARSTVIAGMLLAVSVLLNVVLLTRRSAEGPPPARAVRKEAADPRPVAGETEALPARPGPAASPSPLPSPGAPLPAAAGGPLPSVRQDPRIAEVIDAQEKFSAFWKDLDKLFKAKGRVDDAQYFQAAVTTTADFLELPQASRAQFLEASRSGVAALVRSRQEYDAARSALPPKDKNNPAAYAVYQERKDAVDQRYQEQVKAAVSGVKAVLDPSRPRHAEFATQAERWLRNLVPPKPQQP